MYLLRYGALPESGKGLEIKEHKRGGSLVKREHRMPFIQNRESCIYLTATQWKSPRQVGNYQAQDGAFNSPVANHQGGQSEHRNKQDILPETATRYFARNFKLSLI